jgi:hypothetical protein
MDPHADYYKANTYSKLRRENLIKPIDELNNHEVIIYIFLSYPIRH